MTARACSWGYPPVNAILSDDDVHVWCASLDQPLSIQQGLARTLTLDERVRAERFHFEQDKMRFIVGRGLLRTILGHYLGTEPSQLQFCYSDRGKPSLAETFKGNGIRFNLARSQGLALYAVTLNRQIGADLEYMDHIAEAEQIANGFFSDREKAVFHALSTYEKQEAFFRYWTCKEAYLKACGAGLTEPLAQVEISLDQGDPARLLSIVGNPRESARWSLKIMTPAVGYIAALVIEGHGWHLACWQWPE